MIPTPKSVQIDESSFPMIELLADALPGGFLIHRADENMDILFFNKKVLELYGCENETQFLALTGGSYHGMIHPQDVSAVIESIRKNFQNSFITPGNEEYRIRRRDGEIRWVDAYGHFLHTDKWGEVFCVFMEDSTEKLTEIRKQQEILKIANGLSQDYNAVYLLDLEKNIMNPFVMNNKVSRTMHETIRSGLSYSIVMAEFALRYVSIEDRELFLQLSDVGNLLQKLENKPYYHFSFHRYNERRVPECIQMTAARVEGEPNEIVIGFKPIHDELFHLNSDLCNALKALYESVYYIDLPQKQGFTVFNNTYSVENSTQIDTDIQTYLYDYFLSRVVRQDLADLKEFLDLSTLQKRLRESDRIYFNYLGIMDGIRIKPIHMEIFALTRDRDEILSIMIALRTRVEPRKEP